MIGSLLLLASLHKLPAPPPNDPVLGSTYAGTVLNSYSGNVMQGVSWFTIDKRGGYVAHTIAKLPDADCINYDETGWTGQLYKLNTRTYFAVNTGATEGYVIQISPDRKIGASSYFGTTPGVVEANWFFRDRTFNPDAILNLMRDDLCK